MNSVQLHLGLTHLPVVLSFVGLTILIVSFIIKNFTLTKTAYIVFFIAGLAALPVFFTGEPTEEAVENLPGVSGAIIESHEEIAKWAMIAVASAGLLAITALVSARRKIQGSILKVGVLVLGIISGGLMFQTAHLGGQIRHTEIRSGVAMQDEGNTNAEDNNSKDSEKDND